MRPHACQARQTIFILRQFHLQRAFAGAGVLGKNIENERGAVDQGRAHAQQFFQLALMTRRQFVVKHHHFKIFGLFPRQ